MNEDKILTKAKINIKEGLIELEGSESFVQKNLDELKKKILSYETKEEITPKVKVKNEDKKQKSKKKSEPLKPLSFDVSKSKDKPSLQDFLKEKGDPVFHYDLISCIAYYIKKYIPSLEEFEEDNILYAYKHLRKKLPQDFHQAFLDSKNKKMWIENGSSEKKWKISYDGELHVENELPIREEK